MLWKLVVVVAVSVGAVEAALTLSGQRCGSTTVCRQHEFCSAYHSQCESCSAICDNDSHNYDEITCSKECQNYLHDIRYSKSVYNADDMQKVLHKINVQNYLLVALLIIVVLKFGLELIKWARRNGYISARCFKKFSHRNRINKPPIEPMTHENPNTQSPRLPKKGMNGGPSSVFSGAETVTDTVKTAITPISRRHPAEDSTLDYTYDNRGLETTPVSEKPKNETMF